MDMVTFGVTAFLYNGTFAVHEHDKEMAEAKAASEKPVGESKSGQEVAEWRIGQRIEDSPYKK